MRGNKISVLFVLPSLCLGGAERQVVDLVNGLSKEMFNIHLFTFERGLVQLEKLNREKVHFYNHHRKYKYDFSPSKMIAKIIDTEKIDVLHCTLQIALLYGLIGKIRAKRKVKLIVAIHTTINRDIKDEMFDRLLYVPLMRRCDKIVTVCDNQRKYWSKKYPFLAGKIVTIHNGIDVNTFKDDLSDQAKKNLRSSLGIGNDEFTVGIVAAFRPEKGHEYAFRALKLLVDAGKKIKLVLIGDGQKRDCLQSLADELGISKNIIWLGFQKEPKKYISILDIFLMASYAVETFSIAILEALSMGKPVIAPNIGGVSEQVEHGENGFLFPPRNIKALVKCIEEITTKNLFETMGNKARSIVCERFTAERMIQGYQRFFLL